MLDPVFLKAFEGPAWITLEEVIDRLARLDYWPADMTPAAQVRHVATQVASLVDEDGMPRVAAIIDNGRAAYKRTHDLTVADARLLLRTMQELPVVTTDHNVRKFLSDAPEWRCGIRLFQHAERPGHYSLGLLSKPAAVAFLQWERRRRLLSKAELQELLTALELSPAGKVSRNKVSVCHRKGRSCPVNLARKR